MRLALGLEYDGGAFCGWQTQPEGCGVQDALEAALSEISSEKIETVCAGRTDAGVHALAQVVHFDTAAERPLSAWTRGANALLPEGIAVLWAREIPSDFHARFSATGRRYVYFLLNRAQRPGLLRGRVGWHHRPLDVQAMQDAASCLVGEHDFSAFRAAECQAKSPVKIMREVRISARGELVRFEFLASAFLQHMVRNIVGSLVYVGSGRQPRDWMRALLDGRDRTSAAPTFSAAGLYLAEVEYDPVWSLPGPCNADAVESAVLACT